MYMKSQLSTEFRSDLHYIFQLNTRQFRLMNVTFKHELENILLQQEREY